MMPREGDLARNKAGGAAVFRNGAWHVFAANDGEFNTVKAYADGRMPPLTGAALRNPKMMGVINAVSMYDPTFDAADYHSRVKTRNDFTSGQSARNVTALNTAIGHLGTLKKEMDSLHATPLPFVNAGENAVANFFGSSRTSGVRPAVNAVADELVKAFRGTGGTGHEVDEWKRNFSENASPEQYNKAISTAIALLHSRIDAVGDQYNRGMGKTSDPMRLLSPHAVEALRSLEGGHADAPHAAAGLAAHPHNLSDADLLKALNGG